MATRTVDTVTMDTVRFVIVLVRGTEIDEVITTGLLSPAGGVCSPRFVRVRLVGVYGRLSSRSCIYLSILICVSFSVSIYLLI